MCRRQRGGSLASSSAGPLSVESVPAAPLGRLLLCCVDDDELSWDAVRFTLRDLYRPGDCIHLLHVIPHDSMTMPLPLSGMGSSAMCFGNDPTSSLDMEDELVAHAHAFMRDAFAELALESQARCEVEVVRGACRRTVGEQIVAAADRLAAALIVVPEKRTRNLMEQLLGGDYACFGEYVLNNSTRPTVVYQPSS
ncbi:hypothetical protein FOA52_015567 [Chlamydomonas sp. UWO 241]|nr:hypothetical protein FOA52_015567 [Chlamydomonas sp. UWO 241]